MVPYARLYRAKAVCQTWFLQSMLSHFTQALQASELSLSASGSRLVEVELVGADEVAQRLAMLNNLEIASVVRENVSRVVGSL